MEADYKTELELEEEERYNGSRLEEYEERDHWCAEYMLRRYGGDVNHIDGHHETMLHRDCSNKMTVEWLLALGADPNIQDKDGLTPLMRLVVKMKSMPFRLRSIMKMLIEHGTDLGIVNARGLNVLEHAMTQDSHNVCILELSKHGVKARISYTSTLYPTLHLPILYPPAKLELYQSVQTLICLLIPKAFPKKSRLKILPTEIFMLLKSFFLLKT